MLDVHILYPLKSSQGLPYTGACPETHVSVCLPISVSVTKSTHAFLANFIITSDKNYVR